MKEYFRQKEEFDDKKPHSLTLPPDVRPKEKIQPAPYPSGPIRITTVPACPRSDLRMAVCMVSLCMDLSLSRYSIS
jgi:hypothetical protein